RLARLHRGAARAGRHVHRAAEELPAAGAVESPLGARLSETVLVLRFSAVGDVVLTSPAIDALRQAWPDARIVYAIKERLAHLVRHHPAVNEVIGLRAGEGPLSYSGRLRAAKPTAVLDLH